MNTSLEIREIQKHEYKVLGQLMVEVYSQLDGFPNPDDQPDYYEFLTNIGTLTEQESTEVLVALSAGVIVGGVVYFSDMAMYGSGGIATEVQNASGIRLLGVDPQARGRRVFPGDPVRRRPGRRDRGCGPPVGRGGRPQLRRVSEDHAG